MTGSPPSDEAAAPPEATELCDDVRRGLGARPLSLPPRWFYDDLGSQLFEAICRLPWYPLTRAERRLLERHGRDLLQAAGSPALVVELGGGSGEKLALLLAQAPRAAAGVAPTAVHLVDVSLAALDLAGRTLARLGTLAVTPRRATYERGLEQALAGRPRAGAALVVFLGSNIGNFDPAEAARFLAGVRARLRPGDALLLGADLVKPEADLLLGYDDPIGVTAAFNKNVLQRINRELGADFDLNMFKHRAAWNAAASRVEMHLVALARQVVRIPRAGLVVEIAEGETIWTESSYKYTPESLAALARAAGFGPTRTALEERDRFALTLLTAA